MLSLIMQRTNISSGAAWEDHVGYSRAVRVGLHVHVTGTIAVGPDGRTIVSDDPYEQTLRAIEIIEIALEQAGARLEDVVRTRMYVVDIDEWREIGRAHGEVFGEIRPATTMVEVRRLIDPAARVEIEADAMVAETDADA